jgi:hypothetical protein
VSVTLYAAGRLHQPDYTFSLSGASRVPPEALLATIALGLAAVQVLLASWMYRKLPLPGPPAPGAASRTGLPIAALFAVTVPVAGCSFYGAPPRCSPSIAVGWPCGACRWRAGHSPSCSACCGTPRRCGITTAASCRTSDTVVDLARQARPAALGEAALSLLPSDDDADRTLESWAVADALAALRPEHRRVIVETYIAAARSPRRRPR